jgi:secondary thiamine-phosphate synthase enzyme
VLINFEQEASVVHSGTIRFSSQGNADIKDITSNVLEVLKESDIDSGIVTIFCPSATSALTTIEHESGALSDFRRLFDEIAPSNRFYAHNERWGDGNGHSHTRAALLGPSLTVPFINKKLLLGTWQQIIFVDFDNRPRQRELAVQLVGE